MPEDEFIKSLLLIDKKERFLSELIAWLKAKNLWQQVCKDLDVDTSRPKCKCVHESECHGIEMIKAPSGEENAIGGTDNQDRWKFCPWCGGTL